MPEHDDKTILAQLASDPQMGLAALLEKYGGLIHAVVRRVLPANPQDAEECVADVLVAAWRHAPQLAAGPDRPLQGWLALTARNTAINRYRRLKKEAGFRPLDETFAGDWLLEPRQSDGEDCIAELVAALPEPDREIFLRRYYYLEPCGEIARALGMQEHTVVVRLSRGRARLKQQYLARMGRRTAPDTKKEAASL